LITRGTSAAQEKISGSAYSTGSFGKLLGDGSSISGITTFAGTAGTETAFSGSSTSTGSFGSVHTAGNVGIGTTAPGAVLHVTASSASTPGVYFSRSNETDNNTEALKVENRGTKGIGLHVYSNAASAANALVQIHADNSGYGMPALRVIQDGSGDAAWITGGNVGIGTNSPGAKLDILGPSDGINLRLSDASGNSTVKEARIGLRHYTEAQADTALMYAQSAAGVSAVYIGGGTGTMNAVETIGFVTAATDTTLSGTTRMTIASDGVISGDFNDTSDVALKENIQTISSGLSIVISY
jgi:hypothetical protein